MTSLSYYPFQTNKTRKLGERGVRAGLPSKGEFTGGKSLRRFIGVSTITAFLAGALWTQQADSKTAGQLRSAERTFLQDAAKANQDEIAMAQLAQKSCNAQRKAGGLQLVRV